MSKLTKALLVAVTLITSAAAFGQEEKNLTTEIELGAIFTSGNTEDENVKYGVVVDWNKGVWDYRFSSDGFRSSKDSVLAAQRLYHVARVEYAFNEDSYVLGRLAYEDDRFSGFDSQSDASVSYGRNLLLNKTNMALSVEVGAGIRRSETVILP